MNVFELSKDLHVRAGKKRALLKKIYYISCKMGVETYIK